MAKNVAGTRRKSKTLRLLDGERIFVGVDVHKATYSVALCSDRRGHLKHWKQPAAPETLIRTLEAYRLNETPMSALVDSEGRRYGYRQLQGQLLSRAHPSG